MATLTARNIRKRLGLNTSVRVPSSVTFTPAAGGANISLITITMNTQAGVPITSPRVYDILLSDAATGAGLTATTASGTVQAQSGQGTVLSALTAKKAIRVQTKADGTFVLEITDTAKTGFYVVVVDPTTGAHYVSAQLITANFG